MVSGISLFSLKTHLNHILNEDLGMPAKCMEGRKKICLSTCFCVCENAINKMILKCYRRYFILEIKISLEIIMIMLRLVESQKLVTTRRGVI